jgi:hypothetical protein
MNRSCAFYFISRQPHFGQVLRWPLLLASWRKPTSMGLALVYSWPDIQLDNGVVPSTQKNALDSTLLAFQSSNLNSSEAGSMRVCRV